MSPEWHAPDNLDFLTPEEMRSRLMEAQEFSTRVNTLTEISLKVDAARFARGNYPNPEGQPQAVD